ncbi:MAG: pentose kinase [Alphaproteobacteria bacterium]|nr:pentose kinase [Alphaproteobacteria bacterium]
MTDSPIIAACDLGTGGAKTSLYDAQGACLADAFTPYPTQYPRVGFHEQDPEDWWQATASSIRTVLARSGRAPGSVRALGLSGHSLGAVPLDGQGRLLARAVPIWSDGRALSEARAFFRRFDETDWYMRTGNGFPAHLYSVFKLMWLRKEFPEIQAATAVVLGTKDYVNYRLTGAIASDPSYASGSGVWNLKSWDFDDDLLAASGIKKALFPQIVSSHEVIGRLTGDAAGATGLTTDTLVVAGGVDNSCMALGARNSAPGRIYNSLGSSSWLAVSSTDPVLDPAIRPYVFAHVLPGLFTSAVSIFAAGSSLRWVRDTICLDLVEQAERTGGNAYDLMTTLAGLSVPGANGLIFNPSLAGGTSLDASPDMRGSWTGLDLSHTRADLVRAAMEGVAMGLGTALKALSGLTNFEGRMTIVGGGSNSALWRQILADVYGMRIEKTNIDDQAAALGAAALAAVGAGIWDSLDRVDAVHHVEAVAEPRPDTVARFARLMPIYAEIARSQASASADLVAFRRSLEETAQ